MAPVVGQQLTLSSSADLNQRLDLLEARAKVTSPRPECDLVVRGLLDGVRISAAYDGDSYLDTAGQQWRSDQLRRRAARAGNALTFSCLPPGSGSRVALDRPAD
jgi:hypothetical protein